MFSALDPDNQSEPVVVGVVVGKFDKIAEPKDAVDVLLALIFPAILRLPEPVIFLLTLKLLKIVVSEV